MISPGKMQKKAARGARLSAALRENLKRRKAQARRRAQDRRQEETAAADPAGSPVPGPDFRRNQGRD